MKSAESTATARARLASFLIPFLAVLIPLYQALTNLRIAVTHTESLLIVGTLLGGAGLIGLLAALATERIRVVVLALSTIFILDLSLGMGELFEGLAPANRARSTKDATRVADLERIQQALEMYMVSEGPLPHPSKYGESNVSPTWWNGWWDLSTVDLNEDGKYFLDFLLEAGIVPSVPLDPENQPLHDNREPQGGRRYVYFLSPRGYKYEGGTCVSDENLPVYLLAITELESEAARPPKRFQGSGCKCLWLDSPGFFEEHFDYVLCGTGAAITGSETVPAKSRLSLAETGASKYLLGGVTIRQRPEGEAKHERIEVLSGQGAVAASMTAGSFLQSGSLVLRRDGHAVLSGGVAGGEDVMTYLQSNVSGTPGYPDIATFSEEASLRLSLESPGRITKASFELGVRNYRNKEPVHSTLQVVEEGGETSGPITREAAYDGHILEWTWTPVSERTRTFEVTIGFPYADPYIGVNRFAFRLEVDNGSRYWEARDPTVAIKNSTRQSLEVEWSGHSRF